MQLRAIENANAIICSFYTDDEYYRNCANRLKINLEKIGIDYELIQIEKKSEETWIQICRKKVGFIADVCNRHPDKKIFWVDVDCELFSLPTFILNSTADIIGFQRGFGNPLDIGYQLKARFWEPSFWGINTTKQAREMIEIAAALEKNSNINATDDFFFEEAWRLSSTNLTFQIIPSSCVFEKGVPNINGHQAFFKFGSSGQVDGNMRNAKQHKASSRSIRINRKFLLSIAKNLEYRLPKNISKMIRQRFDEFGITGFLTKKNHIMGATNLTKKLLASAQSGNSLKNSVISKKIENSTSTNDAVNSIKKVSVSFLNYSSKPGKEYLRIAWWQHPHPGNFGDWLTPFIFSHLSDLKILYRDPTARGFKKHIISTGSIGRFIRPNSIVVGTGISSLEYKLNRSANYISLRGPITAELLTKSGGPEVSSFGDPAILLSKILPINRDKTNGRTAIVRHFAHAQVPITLEEDMDEISILVSSPSDILQFILRINQYEKVVTSSLHVLITCHSYGIPCALVTFTGFNEKISGSGIKYTDYCLGADLPPINPTAIGMELNQRTLDGLFHHHKVTLTKQLEVETALRKSLTSFRGKK